MGGGPTSVCSSSHLRLKKKNDWLPQVKSPGGVSSPVAAAAAAAVCDLGGGDHDPGKDGPSGSGGGSGGSGGGDDLDGDVEPVRVRVVRALKPNTPFRFALADGKRSARAAFPAGARPGDMLLLLVPKAPKVGEKER